MRFATAELPTGERKNTNPISVARARSTSHTSRPRARNNGISPMRGTRSSEMSKAASDGTNTIDPAATANIVSGSLSATQIAAPAPNAPPPRLPAWYQPLARPRLAGSNVVRTAPHAEDSNIATTFPASRSTVSCVRESDAAAIATAPHAPDTDAAIITQLRRSRPVSTTGDHKKYHTFGIDEIAMTFAIRSGETPCLRRRNGIKTTRRPLKTP